MNEALWICCLLLTSLVAASENVEESSSTGIKIRRDGNKMLALYPFPRIGRGRNDVTWLFDPYNKLMVGKSRRTPGLMTFPRIGRDGSTKIDKQNDANSNGLWFGPRLGKVQKRDSSDNSQPETSWALIALRGYPPISIQQSSDTSYIPRLGRESNEDPWDDYDVIKQNSEHL